ncbi:MAG: hypothetical protein JOZ47_22060 [Kutzneria sp.]|nr:hypothetical protein [Kutzneria sp.]MBV9847732.1 hypothetical protein [Kutzneria sp.]
MLSTTRPGAAPDGGDRLDDLLDSYHHIAVDVLSAHTRCGEHCATCGACWPCDPACSAAFALDL